jgi:cytochrome c biogenesis protein CcmG, thiol:disulfide interchange protein DsbE
MIHDTRPPPEVKTRHLPLVKAMVIVSIIALLVLLSYGLYTQSEPGPQIGQLAPQFFITTFDGGQESLSELRGQVVVVNFWASWCTTCREEAPLLEHVWQTYKDRGVVFLGIDYVDTEMKALDYLEEFNVTYPNGPDLASKISQSYRVRGVPETFFIGRDGKIAPIQVGMNVLPKYTSPIPENVLVDTIEMLLKEP